MKTRDDLGVVKLASVLNPNYRLDWMAIIENAEEESGVKLGEALILFDKFINQSTDN